MNPWKQSVLDLSRSVIRFLLWFALVLNLAMLSVPARLVYRKLVVPSVGIELREPR